jgi:DNA-nicking Smr family endonuclease
MANAKVTVSFQGAKQLSILHEKDTKESYNSCLEPPNVVTWRKKGIMDSLADRPFANLGKMLAAARRKKVLSSHCPGGSVRNRDEAAKSAVESDAPVPIKAASVRASADGRRSGSVSDRRPSADQDEQAVEELNSLISGDAPFPVSNTPEFVEEAALGVDVRICRKLHRGAFSVQGYCDLHGFDSLTAVDECSEFISRALLRGARCVALIHGRGLSSPGGPVLKHAVTRWLSRGPYRRFVVAFTSAPPWDGGAGVTYVLLRRNPARRKTARKRGGNS